MLNTLKDLLATIIPPATTAEPDEHALQLATAVLLIEVMRADTECKPEEQAAILAILRRRFDLTDSELDRLVQLGEQTAREAYDFHRFTALINRELDISEKTRIVQHMWEVAYVDDHLSAHENHLMRKIADLLYIPHADYVAAKARARTDSPTSETSP